MESTVDGKEIRKFEEMAEEWWDENGKFKPLHLINPTRLTYIKNTIERILGQGHGISVLDVGCGGGLASHYLSKIGYDVTGIDASETNINIAKIHAKKTKTNTIYKVSTIEEYDQKHDVVLSLEVIEHVANIETFFSGLKKATKKGGVIIISTINRTVKSYLSAIIGAEYILKWLPKGTHEWNKFIKPEELVNLVKKHGLNIIEIKGLSLNPLTFSCTINDDVSSNYFMIIKN